MFFNLVLLPGHDVALCCAEGDPSAWPGPKAWPASLVLVSFFSVNICFQALLKALDPVVLDNVPPLN